MEVDFLINQWDRVPEDKRSLELVRASVTELKALLYKLDCCLVLQAVECDRHHLAHPAEMLLFYVHVQSHHVWNSFEVETTILICARYSLKPIRDISDASTNNFDFQISAVFLHQTYHLSSGCRIGLFYDHVWNRLCHDERHASPITAVIHNHTSFDLVF